jgi:hypothetical protein
VRKDGDFIVCNAGPGISVNDVISVLLPMLVI